MFSFNLSAPPNIADLDVQSHFLKVPSLPFHSLISILCKFPTDVDSRVFWSANIRDILFGEYFFAWFFWGVH